MRVTSFFSFLLLAVPVSVIADGASIITALQTVSNATLALNTTVTAFPDDPFLDLFALAPLLLKTHHVLTTINDGTAVALASANLTLAETLKVATVVVQLSAVVQSTLRTVVSAKPKFDRLLVVSPIVLVSLKQQLTATGEFGDAVVAKVPAALKGVAVGLLSPVTVAFGGAIAVYEG